MQRVSYSYLSQFGNEVVENTVSWTKSVVPLCSAMRLEGQLCTARK